MPHIRLHLYEFAVEANEGRGRNRNVGRAGSWGSSADRGGASGGRVYATALCVMALQAASDREALRAAARWRFAPATRDGVPVGSEFELDVEFRLVDRQ